MSRPSIAASTALLVFLFHLGKAAVYPETPEVSSTRQVTGDTVVLDIHSSLSQPLQSIAICEFSAESVDLLSIIIDGRSVSTTWSEVCFGDVYQGMFSYRRYIESCSHSLEIKYLLPGNTVSNLHWYAADPFPIFSIFEACCQARGDVNHSGGLNPVDISDLTYLVDYLFAEGDAPPCGEEADIDRTDDQTIINISDLLYLVEYFYSGGSPPPTCD